MAKYYDDSLAAAWMAKHFEMKFISELGNNLIYDGEFHAENYPYGLYMGEWYYIHPDSLSILKPQINDGVTSLTASDIWQYGNVIRIEPAKHYHKKHAIVLWSGSDQEDILSIDEYHYDRICERNGIAFHWPKEEVWKKI